MTFQSIFRLTREECKNLNGLFGVAYRGQTAIFSPSVGLLHATWLLERFIRDFMREREPSPVHLVQAAIEAFLGSEADVNDPMMIRRQ